VSLGDLGEVEFPATWNMGDKEPTVRDQLIVRVAAFLAAQVPERARAPERERDRVEERREVARSSGVRGRHSLL